MDAIVRRSPDCPSTFDTDKLELTLGAKLSPQQLLTAIAASGYFDRTSLDPGELCRLLENELNIGRDRAIELLTNAGLVQFRHSNDPAGHPRDNIDCWGLTLTDEGKRSLSAKRL